VDRDPQRLKRASGGMDPPFFDLSGRAFNQLCEVARRANVFAAFAPLNDPASDAARAALFAVFEENPRNVYLLKTTEKLWLRLATRYVHAHIQWRIVPETEASPWRVQLQRR